MKNIVTYMWITLFSLCFVYAGFSPEKKPVEVYSKETAPKNTTVVKKGVITLDAGHGGYDGGSLSRKNLKEADIALSLTMKTGEILKKNNYEVVYTRTSDDVAWENDNRQDLLSRVQIAKDANADCFISLHLNYGAYYNDGARGFEIYIKDKEELTTNMAKTLETNLQEFNFTQNRGIKTTQENPLLVIDENNIPAMLVEIGFISDDKDVAYITSEKGQDAIANALAQSIMKHPL